MLVSLMTGTYMKHILYENNLFLFVRIDKVFVYFSAISGTRGVAGALSFISPLTTTCRILCRPLVFMMPLVVSLSLITVT